jgi:hypothetical protein
MSQIYISSKAANYSVVLEETVELFGLGHGWPVNCLVSFC